MADEGAQRPTFGVRDSDRSWVHALLVLGTTAVAIIVLGQIAQILLFFSDILLIFLLAWLLAFVLSPVVSRILRAFPTLPRALVVILLYVIILVALSGIAVLVAGSLATSIAGFVSELPNLQDRLPQILEPWQTRLRDLGFNVDLLTSARDALRGLGELGDELVQPLTDLALASLGIFGSLLLIVFLSLFIVIDKDNIVAFLNRLVPPRYADEARLFETSVASSFGGFLRGQAVQGVIYAGVAAVAHLMLGLDYGPASSALVGVLQTIPFFGPFFSWAPPIVVALLTKPDALLPAFIIMGIGWFVVMNIVQPRVMASAVGIHPVMVLASVLIGLKLAGVVGAVFAIPVAAVVSSFFFHYLNRSTGGPRDVASRAARRIEQREGRHVRVPTAPPLGVPETGDLSTATPAEVAPRRVGRPPTDEAPAPPG
jgi:predicted PurR-regulated permease PerM